jgi:hypothetical protein
MNSNRPTKHEVARARVEDFARLLMDRHARLPLPRSRADRRQARPALRKIRSAASLLEIGALFRADLLRRSGAGIPLDTELRRRLMRPLGFDPRLARLHIDPASAAAARLLQSEAFTIGTDVFFAQGRYQPETRFGLGLIAHELVHVGQQTGPQRAVARLFTLYGGDQMEREAQEKAGHAVQQAFPPAQQRRREPPALARLATQRIVAMAQQQDDGEMQSLERAEAPPTSCPSVNAPLALADLIYARMQAELTPSLPFQGRHLTP